MGYGRHSQEWLCYPDLEVDVLFQRSLLVLGGPLPLIDDHAGDRGSQARLSGLAAGHLTDVEDFFLAFLHVALPFGFNLW
jgi:hypothetical protein